MIQKFKNAVKSALTERKIEEYYATLDAGYVSYQAWIEEKEAAQAASLSLPEAKKEAKNAATVEAQKPLKVKLVEYEDCKEDFAAKLFSKMETAEEEILLFVNKKEFLAEHAAAVVEAYFHEHEEAVLVYGDEDEWNSNRTVRMNPWMKPEFSPDTLLSFFYFGNAFAVRKEALRGIVFLGAQEPLKNLYDLCLQLALPPVQGKIMHLPFVLYHAPNLKCLGTEALYDDLKKEYQKRAKVLTSVSKESNLLTEKNNKISIVIPSKDHPKVLQVCLESIEKTAQNEAYEIIVVDNGSSQEQRAEYEKLKLKYGFNYIYQPMEFNFSHMCNVGAKAAKGTFLLFLNDDIEAKESGWMSAMKEHAEKCHVGAVGAKLYYPDSKMLQHAGITNLVLGPVHKLQFYEDIRSYYFGRNCFDYNVIAVTAACLMVRKEVFFSCGGFWEDLKVAFNDVELCFRLYEKGCYNVQCNQAILYHHESLSRGSDESTEKQLRLQKERTRLYEKHPAMYGRDPFYHPYLNQQILDTGFSFSYEYGAAEELDVCELRPFTKPIPQEWYNECLLISLEYAGDLSDWLGNTEKKTDEWYFQGYQFVAGAENAVFRHSLLLKNVNTQEIYEIKAPGVFRPDLERNIGEGHAAMGGFACVIEKKCLPPGRYQVGGIVFSTVSRQTLCRFVNKFIDSQ